MPLTRNKNAILEALKTAREKKLPTLAALKSITITSTEAPGDHEGRIFSTYRAAFLYLKRLGDSHPEGGGYYKTRINLLFTDKSAWNNARLDLNSNSFEDAHPGKHIRRHCEFYSGVPSRHMNRADQDQLRATQEYFSPGYGDNCDEFLRTHALSDLESLVVYKTKFRRKIIFPRTVVSS